jgi:hypothetical protein
MAGSLMEMDGRAGLDADLGNRSAYWEVTPQIRQGAKSHGSRLALRGSQAGAGFGGVDDMLRGSLGGRDDTLGREVLGSIGESLGSAAHAAPPRGWELPKSAPRFPWDTPDLGAKARAPSLYAPDRRLWESEDVEDGAGGDLSSAADDALDSAAAPLRIYRRSGAAYPSSMKPDPKKWAADFDRAIPQTEDLSRWSYYSAASGGLAPAGYRGERVAVWTPARPRRTASGTFDPRGVRIPRATVRGGEYTRVGDTWVPTRDPRTNDYALGSTSRVAVASGGRA